MPLTLINQTGTVAPDGQVQARCDANGAMVVSNAAGATAANQAAAINGATNTKRILSAAASTNVTSAKASPGTVRHFCGYNAAAAARYLKFYDKASAPTVGSDTPRKTVILQPGQTFAYDVGDYYATGIAFAITTAAADADTGACSAGDILCLNVDYL